MKIQEETIAAISTPPGEGGIGIVRISGKNAIRIASSIFRDSKKKKILSFPHRSIHHGYIIDDNGKKEIIDEVLLSAMRAPKSYTREDVIEINCHGGIIALQKVLKTVLSSGARMAAPGEFTKRAFLNGRIDLTQAEAVADIIKAKTELSLKAGLSSLVFKGLSEEIEKIREDLTETISLLEAGIDFPEDEIPKINKQKIQKKLGKILKEINGLIKTFEKGRILKEGIRMTIAGKPNVGKSSLLNILLGEERAIVTDIPGTTRDTIEEQININGIPVNLTDTAGIRKAKNKIEAKGITLTEKAINRADLIVFVLDASTGITKEDMAIYDEIKDKKTVIAFNKIDLKKKIPKTIVRKKIRHKPLIEISCLKNINIEMLKSAISRNIISGQIAEKEHIIVSNFRHKTALEETGNYLLNALNGLKNSLPEEFIAFDCRTSLDKLGEITGKTTSEDILDKIFSDFCVGK